MQTRNLAGWMMLLVPAALAGCGPQGPGSLENFGVAGGSGEDEQDCVDAVLGSLANVYFEDTIEAGHGSDFDLSCGQASGGPDYAMAWTPPETGTYRAVLYADFQGGLSVMEGGCSEPVVACDTELWPPTVEFQAVAGEDYVLVADSLESGGAFGLEILALGGGGGSCPDGVIQGTSAQITGTTIGGTTAFSSSCGGDQAPERTYLYVPPVPGEYQIDTFGSSFDTTLNVRSGECGASVEIACNDDTEGLESAVFTTLDAGEPITIVVDGYGNEAGEFVLNVNALNPPALCDGVEDLGSSLPAQTSWPAEFDEGDLWQACGLGGAERRFRWIAPYDGLFRFELEVGGGGPTGAALDLVVGGCDGGAFGNCAVSDTGTTTSTMQLLGGEEVMIVSEVEPAPVSAELAVTEVEEGSPGCGQALPSGIPSTAQGNTLMAGSDYAGSCSLVSAPERELWWVAPATGTYLISLDGSNYDTLLYVRDGGCAGPELGCNDDTNTEFGIQLWSSLEVNLSEGQTISIFVDGYNGGGEFELEITQL